MVKARESCRALDMTPLADMNQLVELSLGGSQCVENGAALCNIKTLQTLDLRGTRVKNRGSLPWPENLAIKWDSGQESFI